MESARRELEAHEFGHILAGEWPFTVIWRGRRVFTAPDGTLHDIEQPGGVYECSCGWKGEPAAAVRWPIWDSGFSHYGLLVHGEPAAHSQFRASPETEELVNNGRDEDAPICGGVIEY